MFDDILSFGSYHNLQERSVNDLSFFENFVHRDCSDRTQENLDFSQISTFQNQEKEETEDSKTFNCIVEGSKKQKKKRIRKYISNNPLNKKGRWTIDEIEKYHCFLELHATYFLNSEKRKVDKIFKSMASFISTREAYQCRSHHQKVENKWGSFPNILLKLRLENLKTTDDNIFKKYLDKKELNSESILSSKELENEEELYKKIKTSHWHEPIENDERRTNKEEEYHLINKDNELNEELSKNTFCLMMSEEYENQLSI